MRDRLDELPDREREPPELALEREPLERDLVEREPLERDLVEREPPERDFVDLLVDRDFVERDDERPFDERDERPPDELDAERPFEERDERRRLRPPRRSAAGISSCATAFVSCGIRRSRKSRMRSSSRRIRLAS